MACEAHSNDARDAKRMVWGCAGGAKGVRIAVRGACGAEIRRQCVDREMGGAGVHGRGERCTNGRVRSMRRRDAQVMRGLRSARQGGVRVGQRACGWPFTKQTAQRCAGNARAAKCAARGCAGGAKGVRKRPCGKQTAQRYAGNAWGAKCAAWTMWANCKRCRCGAWGEGVGRCNGTCGAARRGASGRRVLGARAGA